MESVTRNYCTIPVSLVLVQRRKARIPSSLSSSLKVRRRERGRRRRTPVDTNVRLRALLPQPCRSARPRICRVGAAHIIPHSRLLEREAAMHTLECCWCWLFSWRKIGGGVLRKALSLHHSACESSSRLYVVGATIETSCVLSHNKLGWTTGYVNMKGRSADTLSKGPGAAKLSHWRRRWLVRVPRRRDWRAAARWPGCCSSTPTARRSVRAWEAPPGIIMGDGHVYHVVQQSGKAVQGHITVRR